MLKALRSNGLSVVAIHHHMIGTEPTIFFLHYWGTGPADKLAAGFKLQARVLPVRGVGVQGDELAPLRMPARSMTEAFRPST